MQHLISVNTSERFTDEQAVFGQGSLDTASQGSEDTSVRTVNVHTIVSVAIICQHQALPPPQQHAVLSVLGRISRQVQKTKESDAHGVPVE